MEDAPRYLSEPGFNFGIVVGSSLQDALCHVYLLIK